MSAIIKDSEDTSDSHSSKNSESLAMAEDSEDTTRDLCNSKDSESIAIVKDSEDTRDRCNSKDGESNAIVKYSDDSSDSHKSKEYRSTGFNKEDRKLCNMQNLEGQGPSFSFQNSDIKGSIKKSKKSKPKRLNKDSEERRNFKALADNELAKMMKNSKETSEIRALQDNGSARTHFGSVDQVNRVFIEGNLATPMDIEDGTKSELLTIGQQHPVEIYEIDLYRNEERLISTKMSFFDSFYNQNNEVAPDHQHFDSTVNPPNLILNHSCGDYRWAVFVCSCRKQCIYKPNCQMSFDDNNQTLEGEDEEHNHNDSQKSNDDLTIAL